MSAQALSTVLLIVYWSLAIGLSARVITRRLPVGVAMAWIAVMFSIPIAGALLYLAFGEKRLGRHRQANIERTAAEVRVWQKAARANRAPDPAGVASLALDRLARRSVGFPALADNELVLLDDFEALFDALVADIDAAKESCLLDFYIWHEGGRADDVMHALERAAKRGVTCRVLADGLGSKLFLKADRVEHMRAAGVTVVAALPTSLTRSLFARADLRNHRKNVIIDNTIGYTGSQNLVDPRFFKQDAGVGQWVDATVRVRGPVVSTLAAVFEFDWSVETAGAFTPPPPSPRPPVNGTRSVVQVLPSGPGLAPDALHQVLLTSIYAAQDELILTTPYFVPDDAMLTALRSAALRGVATTLIVPARNDSFLVRYASVAHFTDLLEAGVRVALFQGGLLHTKSITIDGETSVFGSVNLDMRSIWLNFEISLLVYDPGFTNRLRNLQKLYIEDSDLLDFETWQQRPFRHRVAENTLRLLSPLL